MWGAEILTSMVREVLSEKVTFKQRLGERKAKPQGGNLPVVFQEY